MADCQHRNIETSLPSKADPAASGEVRGDGSVRQHKPRRERRVARGIRKGGRVLVRWVGSVQLAVVVIACIIVSCIVGTVVPRYRVYDSGWFFGLLLLFVLNICVCTATRFRVSLTRVGGLMTHGAVILIACGAFVHFAMSARGELWLREGEAAWRCPMQGRSRVFGRRATWREFGFALRLDDFVVEYHDRSWERLQVYLPRLDRTFRLPVRMGESMPLRGTGLAVRAVKYLPTLRIGVDGVTSAPGEAGNPALLVEITGDGEARRRWVFASMPGLYQEQYPYERVQLGYLRPVKACRSDVSILDWTGKELRRGTIEVNRPLSFRGLRLYQAGYDTTTGEASAFQVTRERGMWLIYAGFGLLVAGMIYVFYVKPLVVGRRGTPSTEVEVTRAQERR